MYGRVSELRAMLEYDFSQEREFSYGKFIFLVKATQGQQQFSLLSILEH